MPKQLCIVISWFHWVWTCIYHLHKCDTYEKRWQMIKYALKVGQIVLAVWIIQKIKTKTFSWSDRGKTSRGQVQKVSTVFASRTRDSVLSSVTWCTKSHIWYCYWAFLEVVLMLMLSSLLRIFWIAFEFGNQSKVFLLDQERILWAAAEHMSCTHLEEEVLSQIRANSPLPLKNLDGMTLVQHCIH